MKINTVEMAKVATVNKNSEHGEVYPLFGFAIEALIDKIVKYINGGYTIGILLEKEDLEEFGYEKYNELIIVLKAMKKYLVIIGFEEGLDVDDKTLDNLKDAVCDAGLTELENVYEDRIVALDPNTFFDD